MSTARRAPKKKDDIFNKKIPENPKYKHIKHTVDTGSSVTKYMEKLEEIRKILINFSKRPFLSKALIVADKDYKYRKDEIFKRMKVNTFAQLVLQVADVIYLESERDNLSTSGASISNNGDDTPANEERRHIETANENVPPLNLPPEETARQKTSSSARTDTTRSTLQDLIRGVGEVDLKTQEEQHENDLDLLSARSSQSIVVAPELQSLPYLLLDIRYPDEFEQCHIIGAINYPRANLSKTVNYFTDEILSFRNKEGKIIIIYDEDERYAPNVASTFVERGVDNVFMLSGGMKVLNKRFPEGFLSGTLPQSCMPSPPPTRRATKKTPCFLTPDGKHWEFFSRSHLQKIQECLNEELLKQENNSRMSSRVSSRSSVASSSSRISTTSSTSSKKPAWK